MEQKFGKVNKEIQELEPVDRHFLIHFAYYKRKKQYHDSVLVTKEKGGYPIPGDMWPYIEDNLGIKEAIILNITEIADPDYPAFAGMYKYLKNRRT